MSAAALSLALLMGAPAFVERRLVTMGTSLELALVAESREKALTLSEEAVREVARAEELLSTWRRGTPLDDLNHAPADSATPTPRELVTLLRQVFALRDLTGGAFEPAILPLVRAFAVREGGRSPIAAERASAASASSPRWFRLGVDTVTRLRDDAGIDEGAWGKGYALDRAAARLHALGAVDVRLDLGGQVLVSGKKHVERIAHPRRRGEAAVELRLRDGSLSTSGTSERGRHLLDPRTGEPARDFGTVSVVSKSGLVADALSTAFYVLGPEEGLRLSERLRQGGIANEALFLVDEDGALKKLASPGFAKLMEKGDLTK